MNYEEELGLFCICFLYRGSPSFNLPATIALHVNTHHEVNVERQSLAVEAFHTSAQTGLKTNQTIGYRCTVSIMVKVER